MSTATLAGIGTRHAQSVAFPGTSSPSSGDFTDAPELDAYARVFHQDAWDRYTAPDEG